MATGFDKLMSTTPRPAVGKVRVGAPPEPEPGKEGVTVRVAIFFDGTKNNRTNTTKRIRDRQILNVDGHDGGSSYGNFYSNPAIHEFMNNRRDPFKQEVSHYVEGIGTRNYIEKLPKKEKVEVVKWDKDGKKTVSYETQNKTDPQGNVVYVNDEDNGLDDMYGNGFGAGPTGIREKANSGIEQLRIKIANARGEPNDFYIKKIIFNVFGFSRGAAAARHFIHRRGELSTWKRQNTSAELVINFVGLYDSVSSYAPQYTGIGSLYNGLTTEGANTDTVFTNDVSELGLNMGGVPKKVVHLTAADEHRQNFSLTNINSSLAAGVGFELTLPGVHSDIGGSYVEAGQGKSNIEKRSILTLREKQRLIAEGWYTDGSPGPDGKATPNQITEDPHRFSADQWYGVRSLTTDYQFITLKIMHDFASCGGKHEAMDLGSFVDRRWAAYRVPPPLAWLSGYFSRMAERLDGSRTREIVTCPTTAQIKWLRNHYLHRSAKQDGDEENTGMEARADMLDGRWHRERLIIPDDKPFFLAPSLKNYQRPPQPDYY